MQSAPMPPTLTPARFPEQLDAVRGILREYAASLDFELCFQSFEEELAGLPGNYAPPGGAFLVALDGPGIAGIVALRPLDGAICEMKRLYTRPAYRGTGLGRQLAGAIVAEARHLGYSAMRLDTVPQMAAAIGLYESLGFRDIPAYCENPISGARYLELRLRPS
jgi:ribosomal protein S18 acetylase RimI-like enzyme